MTTHTYDEIKKLVADNNKSVKLSNEFIICLIWKESGFNDAIKNASSSATGLMQVTKAAVKDVNDKCATGGVTYTHDDMKDAAKNIICGTLYLDLRIKWAKDTTKGVEGFGTGAGYADKILVCEECMKSDSAHPQTALHKIHT